jgi:hypothetical protein
VKDENRGKKFLKIEKKVPSMLFCSWIIMTRKLQEFDERLGQTPFKFNSKGRVSVYPFVLICWLCIIISFFVSTGIIALLRGAYLDLACRSNNPTMTVASELHHMPPNRYPGFCYVDCRIFPSRAP